MFTFLLIREGSFDNWLHSTQIDIPICENHLIAFTRDLTSLYLFVTVTSVKIAGVLTLLSIHLHLFFASYFNF